MNILGRFLKTDKWFDIEKDYYLEISDELYEIITESKDVYTLLTKYFIKKFIGNTYYKYRIEDFQLVCRPQFENCRKQGLFDFDYISGMPDFLVYEEENPKNRFWVELKKNGDVLHDTQINWIKTKMMKEKVYILKIKGIKDKQSKEIDKEEQQVKV